MKQSMQAVFEEKDMHLRYMTVDGKAILREKLRRGYGPDGIMQPIMGN